MNQNEKLSCPTLLCKGTVHRLESFNFNGQVYAAAARCSECQQMYWMYKRGTILILKDRKVPDQRNYPRMNIEQTHA